MSRRRRIGRILAVIAAGIVGALIIAAPAAAKPVSVRSGDTLSGIVWRECHTGDWSGAARDNARTNLNPHLIYTGQTLEIDCAPAPAQPRQQQMQQQASSGWVAPVGACISSGYGWRWGSMHNGVDLAAGFGTPIRAAAAGTLSTGWQPGGAGNYSTIVHGNGLATAYMHLSSFAVRSGWVNAGTVIGYVGSTGNSTGPHLHFETHTGGLWSNRANPVPFMASRGITLRWC